MRQLTSAQRALCLVAAALVPVSLINVLPNDYMANANRLIAPPSDSIVPAKSGSQLVTEPITFGAHVDDDGAGRASIPLWVPEGRSGLAPRLRLTYHSRSGAAYLGAGWSLSGTRQIGYCRESMADAGSVGSIRFAKGSDYCLDGQRLVPSFGSDQYRFEQDTGEKIMSGPVDEVTHRPSWFKVFHPGGQIDTFGGSESSIQDSISLKQLPGANGINTVEWRPVRVSWNLSKVEDRFGNFIKYEYEQTKPTVNSPDTWIRPNYILFTGFEGNDQLPSKLPSRAIKFHYEQSPARRIGYIDGVRFVQDHLLSRISVSAQSTSDMPLHQPSSAVGPLGRDAVELRSYNLSYRPSRLNGRPLLKEVLECDGSGGCKAPLTLGWQDDEWSFHYEAVPGTLGSYQGAALHLMGLGAGRLGLAYRQLMDITGVEQKGLSWLDERNQLTEPVDVTLFSGLDTIKRIQFEPTQWTEEALQRTKLPKAEMTSDVHQFTWVYEVCGSLSGRGDVKSADWAGFGVSEIAALSCGAVPNSQLGEPPCLRKHFLAGSKRAVVPLHALSYYWLDGNGDGQNGLMWVQKDGGKFFTYSGSDPCSPKLPDPRPVARSLPGLLVNNGNIRVVETEGDGRQGLLGVRQLEVGSDPYLHVVTPAATAVGHIPHPPDTRSTIHAPFGSSATDTLSGLELADINGDGLQDVVSLSHPDGDSIDLEIQINSGAGYLMPVVGTVDLKVQSRPRVRVGDINSDGSEDLLFVVPGGTIKALMGGDPAEGRPLALLETGVPSGDNPNWVQAGDLDTDGRIDLTFKTSDGLNVAIANHAGDLLSFVEHGGVAYHFAYSTLADPAVYVSDFEETAAVRQAPLATIVVRQLQLTLKNFEQQTWIHAYRDGRVTVHRREWLGFAEHDVTERQANTETQTFYDNTDFRRRGLPLRQVINSASASASITETRDWGHTIAGGKGYYQIYVSTAKRRVFLRSLNRGSVIEDSSVGIVRDGHGFATEVRATVFGQTNGRAYQATTTTVTSPQFDESRWLRKSTWNTTMDWTCSGAGCPTQRASKRTSEVTYDDSRGVATDLEFFPAGGSESAATPGNVTNLKVHYERDPLGHITQVERRSDNKLRAEWVDYEADRGDAIYPTKSGLIKDGTRIQTADTLFDARYGVMTVHKDANGVRTDMQYDTLGRLRQRKYADGWFEVRNYLFDFSGRPMIRTTDAGGVVTEEHFDELGRNTLSARQDEDGELIETMTVFDGMGRVKQRTLPYKLGQVGRWEKYTYDGLGRLEKITHPDNSTLKFAYQPVEHGHLIYSFDEKNRQSRHLLDLGGRLVSSSEVMDESLITTHYEYGPYGQRTAVIDPDGGRLEMSYDEAGRLIRVSDPASGKSLQAYNGFGELIWEADSAAYETSGFVSDYDRDTLGRVKTKLTSTGGKEFERSVFHWDRHAGEFGLIGLAERIPSDASQRVQTDFSYDALSRPESKVTHLGAGRAYRESFAYDDVGRLELLTYPDGSGKRMAYGRDGLVQALRDTHTNASFWEVRDRNEFGQVTNAALGNDVVLHRRYDARGHVRGLGAVNARSQVLQDLRYIVDVAGDVESRTDAVTGTMETFFYDELARLSNWTVEYGRRAADTQFTYSDSGDLESRTTRILEDGQESDVQRTRYVSKPKSTIGSTHQLDRTEWPDGSVSTYVYDESGRLIRREDAAEEIGVQYTPFGLPANITLTQTGSERSAFSAIYNYDAFGNRVRKVAGDTEEDLPNADFITRFHPSGSALSPDDVVHFDGPDAFAATEIATKRGIGTRAFTHLLSDGTESPSVVLNANGTPRFRVAHDPFGARVKAHGLLTDVIDNSITWSGRGFGGHEDDFLTLLNFGGRMYDAKTARFLTPDPLVKDSSFGQSFNSYSYAWNNPLKLVDPDGLEPVGIVTATYDPFPGVGINVSVDLAGPDVIPFPSAATSGAYSVPASLGGPLYTDDVASAGGKGLELSRPATTSEALTAFGGGFVKGAALGAGTAYGVGALYGFAATAFSPVGLTLFTLGAGVIGVGLAAYGVYCLVNGGAQNVIDTADRIYSGEATVQDFTSAGAFVGELGSALYAGPLARLGASGGSWAATTLRGMTAAREASVATVVRTRFGYDVNDTPGRVEGPWTIADLKRGAAGVSPKQMGGPIHVHHGGQMPGSGVHEIHARDHLGKALHPNPIKRVTDSMRKAETPLHWWYRSQEMGGRDILGPAYFYDNLH